ncbi:cation:proton antiporter [Chloroflexota bacterium]
MDFLGLHINTGTVESTAFVFGLLLIFGVLGGRVARKFGLPAITGYLVFGILLNPQISQKLFNWSLFEPSVWNSAGELVKAGPVEQVEELIIPIALSLIAYVIGGSLRIDNLKGLGKSVSIVTLTQGLAPFVLVILIVAFAVQPLVGSYLPDLDFSSYVAMGLVAGAISLATAPAAVVAVLHELKAKGPLTNTILAVVALDDALAVICFAIMEGFSWSLLNSGGVSATEMIVHPAVEVLFSLLLGLIFAFILIYAMRYLRRQRVQTTLVVLGLVVACGGVAYILDLSIILANMAFGFVVVNRMKHSRMIDAVIGIEDIVFVLFFTLAGATFLAGENLNSEILLAVGVIGVLIVLARCAGKFGGSWLGAKMAGAPETVRKYLGFSLLPAAGVSIGLALSLENKAGFESISQILVSAIFVVVIITEIIAPPLVKYGVMKSGEGRLIAHK